MKSLKRDFFRWKCHLNNDSRIKHINCYFTILIPLAKVHMYQSCYSKWYGHAWITLGPLQDFANIIFCLKAKQCSAVHRHCKSESLSNDLCIIAVKKCIDESSDYNMLVLFLSLDRGGMCRVLGDRLHLFVIYLYNMHMTN